MRTWGISFGEKERMELERIILDNDRDAALAFLKEVIYSRVKESEKPGSCFHDTGKPVDKLERPVDFHKKLGDFR
ncbi:MAG: hypothetical protein H5T72_00115 [Actinobacteria bacterium]|nr:hypothetical protein [Actinomycetota bacterium]